MLAIFDQTVAKSPEGLKSPEGHVGAVSGVGPLTQLFASSHEGAVTVSLGSSGAIAYDSSNQNPFLPRLFGAVDDIFCLFQGTLDNITSLKQQYGLSNNSTANEVIILIEAYRSLRDRGPFHPSNVARDLSGRFAFILFDTSKKSTFIATDGDGSVPFFWGINSEDHMILSNDMEIVKQSCGKSFAPFPKGCYFTTNGGLKSFEHPSKEMKAMPRVDSQGQVCGANYQVDTETKKETKKGTGGMPRVGSAADWSSSY
ncbi:hypothetical protein LUZ61_003681 [Rhynchospora tenuis]|uniref:DUF3700 domain-containing protein n=1 Tax=Rhynchospora tenuis TaxID=198213 RepID=A0AAD5ZL83_9POAL|nr:hypothetical protein LUZ61_003681 [Rhynchospora tenuis]